MRKSVKAKKVFGLIAILVILGSVFGGAVSALGVPGGLTQSVDDVGIQTAVDVKGHINNSVTRSPEKPVVENFIWPATVKVGEEAEFYYEVSDQDGDLKEVLLIIESTTEDKDTDLDPYFDSGYLKHTFEEPGTYRVWIAVRDEALNYDRSDFHDEWADAEVLVEPNIDAQITDYSIDSGTFYDGDEVDAWVKIANTGNVRHTFYIGYSVKDKNGKWWDAPYKSVTLDPGYEGSETLPWEVGQDYPEGYFDPVPGSYDAAVAVWEGKSGDVLEGLLDRRDKYNAFVVAQLPNIDAQITNFDVEEGTFHPGDVVGADACISNGGDTDYTFNIEYAIRDFNGAYYTVYDEDRFIAEGSRVFIYDELDWTIPSNIAVGECWGRLIVSDPDAPSTYYDTVWDYDAFTVVEPNVDAKITNFDVEEGIFHPGDVVGAEALISNEGDTDYTFNIEYAVRDFNGAYYTVYDEDQFIGAYPSLSLTDELDWTIPSDIAGGECWGRLIVSDPDAPSTYYDTVWDYDAFTVEIPEKPDLTLEAFYFTDDAFPSNEITVATTYQKVHAHLTLKNKGGVYVDKTEVELFRVREGDDELLGSKEISNIPSGCRLGFAIDFYPPSDSGRYELYAIVDRENIVDEGIHEDNNEISTELKVLTSINYVLDVKVIYPENAEHIYYRDSEIIIPIMFELVDSQNNRKIDFIQNAKLEGYIDAMPLTHARPDIKLSQLPFEKFGDKYDYTFDTHQYKEDYGGQYNVDPNDMTDIWNLAFVWGEYWVHVDSFSYPPNENNPEDLKSVALYKPDAGNLYFTIGQSEFFMIDQVAYPLWYAIVVNEAVDCVGSLTPARWLLYVTKIISAISEGKPGEVANNLIAIIAELKDLPGYKAVSCVIDFYKIIIGELPKLGIEVPDWARYYDTWQLWSPATLHVYDQYGNHVGVDPAGGIDEEIPGVGYSGPDMHPQVVFIIGQQEDMKIVVKGTELGKKRTDSGKFDLTGKLNTPGKKQNIDYTDVPISSSTIAKVEVSTSNPDYTMEIDEDGDGTTDYTRYPDSMNNHPVANFTYTPKEPIVNQTITLDASSSYDPDGSIVNYSWNFGDGTNGTGVVLTYSYSNPGNYWITLTVEDDGGDKDTYTQVVEIVESSEPELSYSPTSHNFGDMCEGVTDSTTFEIRNLGSSTLSYSVSESCDWVEVNPTSGSSTGEHDTITVDIDTTELSEGTHACDISISSNGGNETFTVTVNIIPYENILINPGFEDGLSSWSSTGGSATYLADATNYHTGLLSAKGIELNTGNLGRLYQDFTAKLIPGEKYKIGGWIKTENVEGHAIIALDYVNDGGWCPADGYVKEVGHVTGTNDWAYYESNWFTLPSMPDDCSMLWFLFDFNVGKGTAWWDDVFLYGPVQQTEPELAYSPTSYAFGDMCEGITDSTSFEIWNSGSDTLTYSVSESCDWVEVNPTSGSSTGEHDTITVDIDTTGLSEGPHTCDILIISNGGSGTFTVTVNIGVGHGQGQDIAAFKDGMWALKYGPVNEIPNFQNADKWLAYGTAGWTPVVGDFNNDGTGDIAIFQDGWWALKYGPVNAIADCQPADKWLAYGVAGWTPVVGDFNNDGIDDIAIFQNGWWALKYGPVNAIPDFQGADKWLAYGTAGWTPVVGDFNNDDIDDIAIFQDGWWALKYGPVNAIADCQPADKWLAYGVAGWTPVVGDYNNDDIEDIAIFQNGWWALKYGPVDLIQDCQPADKWLAYGTAGWTPVVGDFDDS